MTTHTAASPVTAIRDLPANYRVVIMVDRTIASEVTDVDDDGTILDWSGEPMVISLPGSLWFATEKWNGSRWLRVHNASTLEFAVDAAFQDYAD